MSTYHDTTGQEIGFLDWMRLGVPIAFMMLITTWFYLTRGIEKSSQGYTPPSLPTLKPMNTYEKRVLLVFGLTALAWITRTQPFGGWTGALGLDTVGDDTIALTASAFLFVIPRGDGQRGRLMNWDTAAKMPWGILILFGGGIAIAKAFATSGLSRVIGESLSAVTGLPVILTVAVICLTVTFLTEMTSNTATTTLLMPILAAAALAQQLESLILMLPAALSASCAFMLPVATAPNAIVFGTGKITTVQMAKTGFTLNLIGVVIITLSCLVVF